MKDIPGKAIPQLRAMLDAGDLTACELLDAVLARHAAFHARINAVIDINETQARAAARAADERIRQGRALTAVDGIPVTVKDNLGVAGMRATWGSKAFADRIATADDLAIRRLRSSGAVIWGKTNLPELALAGITDNELFGATRNPIDPNLTPGGSSGGAAAGLAAGLGPIAVGTDAGGSARRPAAYTGTVGFRPSNGMIVRGSMFPSTTYDCQVIAPMGRTVADVQALFAVLAGGHPRDRSVATAQLFPTQPGRTQARPLRILYFPSVDRKPVEPVIAQAIANAAKVLEGMGHDVNEVDAPYRLEEIDTIWSTLIGAGVTSVVGAANIPTDLLTSNIRAILKRSGQLTAADHADAVNSIHRIRREFDNLFENFDILLSPTSPCFPWMVGEPFPKTINGQMVGARDSAIFLAFINIAGLPAISVPIPGATSGLPVGLQLAGGLGQDVTLLSLAAAIETTLPLTPRS